MWPFLSLGLALFIAYPVGRICRRWSVPRVTGYLVAGLALGPSGLGRLSGDLPGFLEPLVLGRETVEALGGVSDLALALILFVIGTGFAAERIRAEGRRTLLFSAVEMGLTFFAVTALALFVAGPAAAPLALALGAVAVATAPAATLLVLRDLESEGPVTDRILTLVGLDNVGSLLLFALVFGGLALGDPGGSVAGLGVAVAVGLVTGIAVSAIFLQVVSDTTLAVVGLAGVITAFGAADALGGDRLLACMVLGATLANASPFAEAVRERLRSLDYPLYVAFFVLAGADLQVDLLVGAAGPPGTAAGLVGALVVAYVLGRSAGKALSGRLYGRLVGRRTREARLTGVGLLAQAGLAIGLAEAAVRSGHPDGGLIQTVVLASVVFFELVGPLGVRFAVVYSGEVKILNLLPERAAERLGVSLRDALERLRRSLGLPSFPGGGAPLRAVDLMRRNIRPLRADAHFEEVIHRFATSPYDQYPVVEPEGSLIGVISYPVIRTILFDDALEAVVVAADLITGPGLTCSEETPLEDLIRLFEDAPEETSHVLVVKEADGLRVVGVVDQREAMLAYRSHS